MAPRTSKTTKQLSITVPKEIYNKLDILNAGFSNGNISGMISKILADFFNDESQVKQSIGLNETSMLVPIDIYKKTEEIGHVGFNARIDRGDIKIVEIGMVKYVALDEHNVKHIYSKLNYLDEKLKQVILSNLRLEESIKLLSK